MNKTIAIEDLDNIIDQLYKTIISSNYKADVILYIERAGKVIGEPLATKLSIGALGIKAERSGGKLKRALSKHLFFIPKSVIQKIKYLELKSNFNSLNKNRNIIFNENINGLKNILVVDDAIDSGETIKQVVEYIKNISYAAICRIAVITTTTDSPLISPDYFIYENTVCNFPWSIDSDYYEEFIKRYGEYYK